MSDVSGSGRKREQAPSRRGVARWISGIVVRVCVGVVIGLLAPHVPQTEPPGNTQPGVCIVDTRT